MAFKKIPVTVVIAAAGAGNRMKAGQNKLFLEVRKVPILLRTLCRMEQSELVDSLILVCKEEERPTIENLILNCPVNSRSINIVTGGKERKDSVNNGLKKVLKTVGEGYVMVHDGARPFFSEQILSKLLETVSEDTIAVPALKIFETVRKLDAKGKTEVVDRSNLYTIQTPQVFQVGQIESCFLNDDNQVLNLTDEASYFEVCGKTVKLIEGEKWNIKITAPEDLVWAEALLEQYQQLRIKGLDY